MSVVCMLTVSLSAINRDIFETLATQKTHPFSYDLGMKIISGKKAEADITICCHGYGGDNRIIDALHSHNVTSDYLVGFNFPDYNLRSHNYTQSSFGTIAEILPLLYVIKRWTIDAKTDVINLYGFSAGGGAVINALAVLNTTTYDADLATIGITQDHKRQMLNAIQNGRIVLDCPLKSMDEIIALRGTTPELALLAENYARNNMRPIDVVSLLEGLTLRIFLYFETPDEIIGNRDDALFSERLRVANKGFTCVIFGSEGGHNSSHKSLWELYKSIEIEENEK